MMLADYYSGLGTGDVGQFTKFLNNLPNLSHEDIQYFQSFQGNPEELLADLTRGTYDADGINALMSNLFEQSDDIDGEKNLTSSIINSHIGEIQTLLSQEDIDYEAILRQTVQMQGMAGVADTVAHIILPTDQRLPDEIDEFNGATWALFTAVLNNAQDQGVDVVQVLEETKEKMFLDFDLQGLKGDVVDTSDPNEVKLNNNLNNSIPQL
jgi:hypothetical protein